mgnify:CR=1 FL=1
MGKENMTYRVKFLTDETEETFTEGNKTIVKYFFRLSWASFINKLHSDYVQPSTSFRDPSSKNILSKLQKNVENIFYQTESNSTSRVNLLHMFITFQLSKLCPVNVPLAG